MYSKLWMDEFNKQITKGEHAPREFLVAQFVMLARKRPDIHACCFWKVNKDMAKFIPLFINSY